ncbi:hydrolase [Gordonia spumicola]|uniref:Hydrolase n=1 Tax=Gordonia spumicola TaxID=589161 RepID=A0A7I9VE77_9ACTN|nr:carbon-nitrogen family hydrolase [Gordonia spumicola]GEE03659.1 hydrolase [Gordonia spumicola]
MRIAMVQIASADEETPDARLARVTEMVRGVPTDVDLIVLPELWKVGFCHFDEYAAAAEPLDGPTVTAMSAIAAERGCLVHMGSIVRRADDGALYNTSVLLGADGSIVHTYDKVHLFGYKSVEPEILTPGTHVDAVDTEFGALAAATCYDLRFPPLWASLGETGADIVIVPAAWPARRRTHWQLLTGARAVDNQVYVVAVNAVGTHAGVELGGHSRVVDPWGEVVAEGGVDEGVTVVQIDPSVVTATRTEFPVLRDRLTDYTTIEIRKAVHA